MKNRENKQSGSRELRDGNRREIGGKRRSQSWTRYRTDIEVSVIGKRTRIKQTERTEMLTKQEQREQRK